MALESLLNKPLSESELLDLLIAEVRQNYDKHQNTYYFLKLSYSAEKTSEIIWMRSFDNRKDFGDFVYDTKFFRAAILLKFKNGHYEVFCEGFHYFDVFEVWPDKIKDSRPIERSDRNLENTRMLPRELIEKGFGEISQCLSLSKSNIPI